MWFTLVFLFWHISGKILIMYQTWGWQILAVIWFGNQQNGLFWFMLCLIYAWGCQIDLEIITCITNYETILPKIVFLKKYSSIWNEIKYEQPESSPTVIILESCTKNLRFPLNFYWYTWYYMGKTGTFSSFCTHNLRSVYFYINTTSFEYTLLLINSLYT